MTLKIGFHSNQLSLRGTEIALFDYASYNQTLLNNNSVIFYDASSPHNDGHVLDKFKGRFEVIAYNDRIELDSLLRHHAIDLLYAIKSGKKDGLLPQRVPMMVHAVFPTSPSQVHGASYAFISEWLSEQCSNKHIPCVPHIVALPDETGDLRSRLGIPNDGLVLGCHGGRDNFDVTCAIQAVRQLLIQHQQMYFIGLNLASFVDHPRAIFLPGTTDLEHKTCFINSCDVMLHARRQGESFGLACGEFSVRNKPVITYAYGKHTHHHEVLGKRGFYYTDSQSLMSIVLSLNRSRLKAQTWDRYTQRYNPAKVMDLFDRHLIHPALKSKAAKSLKPGLDQHWAYAKLKLKMRLNRLHPD